MATHTLPPHLLSVTVSLFLLCCQQSVQLPTQILQEEDTYVAAVVEFAPNITLSDMLHVLTPREAVRLMMYNLNSWERLVERAREKGADIVVFPEDGLYGFAFPSREFLLPFLEEIPEPRTERYTLCGDTRFSDRPILTHLSCLAARNKITLVANMGDKQKCSNTSRQYPALPTRWVVHVQHKRCL